MWWRVNAVAVAAAAVVLPEEFIRRRVVLDADAVLKFDIIQKVSGERTEICAIPRGAEFAKSEPF